MRGGEGGRRLPAVQEEDSIIGRDEDDRRRGGSRRRVLCCGVFADFKFGGLFGSHVGYTSAVATFKMQAANGTAKGSWREGSWRAGQPP